MKTIAILILIAVLVALVAGPAMTVLQTQYEQARADRQAAEARMELARADTYAVRSQANQPVLLAITGLVLAATVIGGLAVALLSRHPSAPVSATPQASPQVHVVVISQLSGESRPEFLRRVSQLAEPADNRSVVLIDSRRTIDAEQ